MNGTSRAVRRPDLHVLQALEGGALVGGIADHDLDLVAPALEPLRLLAIKGLAHLPGDVRQRDAQRLGTGQQFELQLALAPRGSSRRCR
ncbi:MAG: hypothetical protein R3F11_30995 [Verrucomicrobiales bacterium]